MFLVKILNPRIIFRYNDFGEYDGTGAQIQRLFSIMGFSKHFGFSYLHSPIRNVTTHPLDPFYDSDSKSSFILYLNSVIHVENFGRILEFDSYVSYKQLRLRSLLFVTIRSKLKKQRFLIDVFEIYSISDFFPEIYLDLPEMLIRDLIRSRRVGLSPRIAVHYRQGVGGFAIYDNQNTPREVSADYFVRNILELHSKEDSNLPIIVFTDAPSELKRFRIKEDELKKWQDSPGFSKGFLEIQPNALLEFQSISPSAVTIERGGNPIEAIIEMSASTHLILGKSSLSYVAGILNNSGVVVFHPEFWHPSLPNWRLGLTTSPLIS